MGTSPLLAVPLASHSLPITSLFFVRAPLSYLEMCSVNRGNHDSWNVVSLKLSVVFFVVVLPRVWVSGKHMKELDHSRMNGGFLRDGEHEGVHSILTVFMFVRTGSVFNSMSTFRKQY